MLSCDLVSRWSDRAADGRFCNFALSESHGNSLVCFLPCPRFFDAKIFGAIENGTERLFSRPGPC